MLRLLEKKKKTVAYILFSGITQAMSKTQKNTYLTIANSLSLSFWLLRLSPSKYKKSIIKLSKVRVQSFDCTDIKS